MKTLLTLALLFLAQTTQADVSCKFDQPAITIHKEGIEYVINVVPKTKSGVCYTAIVPDRSVSGVVLYPDQLGFQYKEFKEPKFTYPAIVAARYRTTQTGKVRLRFLDKKANTARAEYDFSITQ